MVGGRLAGGEVRARQRRGLFERRARGRRRRAGRRARPASGGTNSGGPPIRVATTERPQAIASSSAWPSGSTRLGWARTRLSASSRGISSCGTRPSRRTPFASLQLRPEGPVAGKGERSLAETRERVGEAHDVLPLVERADAEKAGRPGRRLGDREALAVDAARDDLHLAAGLGQLRLELPPQVVGDADHRRRPPHDEAGRGRHARERADVADVPAVCGDDERGAAGERGDQAGRDEEVRVDHVRPARRARPAREGQVAELPARARVEDGELDLVSPRRRARARPARRTCRGRARRAPGTSARRGGCARQQRKLRA